MSDDTNKAAALGAAISMLGLSLGVSAPADAQYGPAAPGGQGKQGVLIGLNQPSQQGQQGVLIGLNQPSSQQYKSDQYKSQQFKSDQLKSQQFKSNQVKLAPN